MLHYAERRISPQPEGGLAQTPGRCNPELAVVCWSVGLLLVFVSLAVRQFRRKVLG